MPDTTTTETEVVGRLAQEAARPTIISDPSKPQVLVVPNGSTAEILNLDGFLDEPRRKKGVYRPADVTSFIDYTTIHAIKGHTTVWVDPSQIMVVALINDNAADKSGWGDHRARLDLKRTPEWQHWLARDGEYLTQEKFAEHLQEGILEITDPEGAEMLEIAQTLQGSTDVQWKSANRVDNGAVSFKYQEEVKASAGVKGELEVPQEMTLGVSPFFGEEVFSVTARIRYRVRAGALTIGYKLERPTDVELNVLQAITDRLKGEFEDVYLGSPAG